MIYQVLNLYVPIATSLLVRFILFIYFWMTDGLSERKYTFGSSWCIKKTDLLNREMNMNQTPLEASGVSGTETIVQSPIVLRKTA
jgi:hypothetical protein